MIMHIDNNKHAINRRYKHNYYGLATHRHCSDKISGHRSDLKTSKITPQGIYWLQA